MIQEEMSDCEEFSGSKMDSLNLNSLDYWDYSIELECLTGPEDLQLAVELGKTLLERNKELETSLRQCQNIIDEQAQEIEHLTKHTAALQKANDNKIIMYEHLEVNIQELERANQKLALDNSTHEKHIKSLYSYRDMLEARCEELQNALEEAKVQQRIQKEKLRRMSSTTGEEEETKEKVKTTTVISQTSTEQQPAKEDLISQLSVENQELKSQVSQEQRKIADLEDEISQRIHDITLLEEERFQKEEQVKSLRQKISYLEQIKSENLCEKCMKEMDVKMPEGLQMCNLEEDSFSDSGKYPHLEIQEDITVSNMYKSIVKEPFTYSSPYNCLPLQDELKPFDLYKDRDEDEEAQKEGEENKNEGKMVKSKVLMAIAADLSEAETSSSGYNDETSNKWTQTEPNMISGSFLCSFADGDDCKFSVYDDACPIESRLRRTPEYRTLFREILEVLKKAVEATDNIKQLPLLNDLTPVSEAIKVPPVTPAKEEAPVDFEDLQSLPEPSNISEAASETVDVARDETIKNPNQEDSSALETPGPSSSTKNVRITNDFLEYISVELRVRKKPKTNATNSPAKKAGVSEMVERIEGSTPNSPRKSSRRRKQRKNYDSSRSGSRNQSPAIQPHVLTTLERKETPPGSQRRNSGLPRRSPWTPQPFVSTAAQEVAQLKKLEKSYAEILKHMAPPKNYSRPKSLRLVP